MDQSRRPLWAPPPLPTPMYETTLHVTVDAYGTYTVPVDRRQRYDVQGSDEITVTFDQQPVVPTLVSDQEICQEQCALPVELTEPRPARKRFRQAPYYGRTTGVGNFHRCRHVANAQYIYPLA